MACINVIKKTEKIDYWIKREKHEECLREMKPATNTGLGRPNSLSTGIRRERDLFAFNRRYQIRLDNRQMVGRILTIAKSSHTPKISSPYSRLPLSKRNLVKKQELQRQNEALADRLMRVPPAVGSLQRRNRCFQQSL